jgi:hypothetical protein
LPASGSSFAVGSTTVTCTATDAVGHTASGSFQVIVSAVAPPTPPSPTAIPRPLPIEKVPSGTNVNALPSMLGLASLLGLVALV